MPTQTMLGKTRSAGRRHGRSAGCRSRKRRFCAGTLTPDTLVDAVLSCTNCTDPEACRKWLDTQQGTAATTPGYCRNTELLEGLRDGALRR
jgi:hypothetical protein